MDAAPLHGNLADGPPGGAAFWVRADDGVRLRVALWPCGKSGTVLLFPGRTEYVEKYGRIATALSERGFSTITIDWRGQGLADRPLKDLSTGHVHHFRDYQKDVAAMVSCAEARGLPRPFFLIAHSMGGAIGLRALHEGLDVEAVAFSAPMWGIAMPAALRPVAWCLSSAGRSLGFGHRYTPGTGAATYISVAPFEQNLLTGDDGMYDYMIRQTNEQPALALGGPSLHWLKEALAETRDLRRARPPDYTCYCAVGTEERVVDVEAVHKVMARWPEGRLEIIEGSRHEILMEAPAIRHAFLDAASGLFLRRKARRRAS